MKRGEAIAILKKPRNEAIASILELAEKAEKYDALQNEISPSTPSGMTPVYLKPRAGKKGKGPGRKQGHEGISRKRPDKVNHYQEHSLNQCPDCGSPLKEEPTDTYQRCTEDIPKIESEVTEHTVHGYWCSKCQKMVYPKITDALPNSLIGLRVIVLTAWLHYLIGCSVRNLVKMLDVFHLFKISAGGLTQAWGNLASLLTPFYDDIGQKVATCAVLCADETGWRLNGITHWLWGFASRTHCFYIITRSRGSPVVKDVLGIMFRGVLICDFWGAYNKICALAKQRCFFHLFTELVKVDKHNTSHDWKAFRKKLSRMLKDAVRLSERKQHLEDEQCHRLKKKLRDRLQCFLAVSWKDKDARRLVKRLKRHRDEIFTFLEYDGVSPYNNHAEQQMRKPVLVRKISQQNRSERGARTQAILMTLFRSAELQGRNPVQTVLALAEHAIQGNLTNDECLDLAA